ncbi:uncharacterized protein [Macrobrachium rosenbergii]|uniref:uncharacterized protein n=1 Tax=Macrobrachium rosenbergii TaxID=79674 RepID=UPI0034D437E5
MADNGCRQLTLFLLVCIMLTHEGTHAGSSVMGATRGQRLRRQLGYASNGFGGNTRYRSKNHISGGIKADRPSVAALYGDYDSPAPPIRFGTNPFGSQRYQTRPPQIYFHRSKYPAYWHRG